MKWKRLNPAGALAILSLAAGAASLPAQGVSRLSRPIEFSDAKVQVVTSNLNRSADASVNALRPLDDRFSAPYRLQDSASQIDGAQRMLPAARPPTLDPRAVRELMDKRKEKEEWLFDSPDELETEAPTMESLFGLPEFEADGTEKKTDKSPAQRFWERGDNERYGATNRASREAAFERTDEDIKAQARIIFFGTAGLADGSGSVTSPNSVSSSPLTRNLTTKLAPDLGGGRSSGALFAITPGTLAPPRNEVNSTRLDEYRQLFDNVKSPNPMAAGALGDSSGARFTRPSSFKDLSPTPSWQPPSVAAPSGFGSISSPGGTRPTGFAPVSGLVPALPATTQPQRPMTSPSGFQLPKRTF